MIFCIRSSPTHTPLDKENRTACRQGGGVGSEEGGCDENDVSAYACQLVLRSIRAPVAEEATRVETHYGFRDGSMSLLAVPRHKACCLQLLYFVQLSCWQQNEDLLDRTILYKPAKQVEIVTHLIYISTGVSSQGKSSMSHPPRCPQLFFAPCLTRIYLGPITVVVCRLRERGGRQA